MGDDATPQTKPPIVRIFTSIVKLDEKGAPQKQFFDVPLLKAPPVMLDPYGRPAPGPTMTDWQWFMTNFLQHRGLLVENAWIPERMVELLIVDPESNPLLLENVDLTNVVRLR